MPIARFQMPDGKIARFEVPEGTTPEAAQLIMQEHFTQPVENPAINRFLSGVGGNILNAASGIAELLPGVSERNPIALAGQEGLKKATGTAGEIGKFIGNAAPYVALPEGIVPAALAATGIGTLVGHGTSAERINEGINEGAGAAIGNAIPKVMTGAGTIIGHLVGNLGTHTGGETIVDAAKAGYAGNEKLKALLTFMRNKAPLSDIVQTAKKGEAGLARQDSMAYNNALNLLKQDKTILPYGDIEQALNSANTIGMYQGHVVNPAAVNVHTKLTPIIEEWSGKPYPIGKPQLNMTTGQMVQPMSPPFDPALAHTIEGLDQLKKRIGIEYKSTSPGTPERIVAKDVYGAVKNAIENQSPDYKGLMVRTQNAIRRRAELKKELSLNENMTDSTALRKLLAVPRNNANTNYGNRVALAKLLEENGADNLMTMLNGAALSSAKPRGLGVIGSGGTAGAGIYSALTGNIPAALTFAGLTGLQSPRLMGELAVKTGQLAKKSGPPFNKTAIPAIISAIKNRQDGK